MNTLRFSSLFYYYYFFSKIPRIHGGEDRDIEIRLALPYDPWKNSFHVSGYYKFQIYRIIVLHYHIMIISGPRNRHNDSADILGPKLFNMRWFLALEIVQKWWFLGPENFIMTLQNSGPRNHHSGTISGPRNHHYDQENLYGALPPCVLTPLLKNDQLF